MDFIVSSFVFIFVLSVMKILVVKLPSKYIYSTIIFKAKTCLGIEHSLGEQKSWNSHHHQRTLSMTYIFLRFFIANFIERAKSFISYELKQLFVYSLEFSVPSAFRNPHECFAIFNKGTLVSARCFFKDGSTTCKTVMNLTFNFSVC